MIIIKLKGGIGNQMFQYAAAFNLAQQHNTTLYLDIFYLLDKSKRRFRHTNRDYALNVFNISAQIATAQQISRFTVPRTGNKYLYYLRRRLRRERGVFVEGRDFDVPTFHQVPDNAYLEGSWQHMGYFDSIHNIINSQFRFNGALPDKCLRVREHIRNECSVCIVFRRGDYVGHPLLDIVSMEFYRRAVAYMNSRLTDPTYFVFSDDISWCKQNFTEPVRKVFVEQDCTGDRGQDYLMLMSCCGHFIMPNSTFPWWAAQMAQNPKKLVIAPKVWFKGQTSDVNNIVPTDWVSL